MWHGVGRCRITLDDDILPKSTRGFGKRSGARSDHAELLGVVAGHGPVTETIMGVPKSYRSLQEFEREELGRDSQAGFNLDDLIQEATFGASDMLFDDTVDEYDPSEMEEDD